MHTNDTTDKHLAEQLRDGDMNASAALFVRHYPDTLRYAARYSRNGSTAEDLAASAFECTLRAIRNGAGPDTAFRAYLHTCVRHAAHQEALRTSRIVSDSALDLVAALDPGTDPEWDVVARAYRALPERWRAALWYTLVEDISISGAAAFMDLSPNAMTALAARARDGLRKAYAAEQDRAWVAPAVPVRYATATAPVKPKMHLSRGEHIQRTASLGQPAKMTLSLSRAPKAKLTLTR